MTADALPRLHVLGKNAVAMAGYNGRGIAPGTVFGKALAEHVLGLRPLEAMPLPVSPITPASLRLAQEAGYSLGAAAAHLLACRI
jgi:glycine/D-amino acid oxidase-like deaminating enzyme